ncbi:peptidoglycan/xylan/chitin deacetylase (PgdA/CDA1 family) [Bacillus pumilus]|uniref:polysaccharide deacetylase family protein n=1 Tax=Bacillus pumilus TaxID=1408 RepID=UPI0028581FC5|nr:polysaccharide deacetylase family protein [Bacillus pumilus]MDR6747218.1 peptidoglycan/xylan/chitin deacetylase (PgdA/CDA1 family) [Bacillus pumilus]
MSMKWKISLVLCGLAIIIGIAAFYHNQQASGTEKKKVEPDASYKEVEIVTLVNDGRYMRYAVNYPVFHQEKLDQEMKRYAETALDKFKTSFSEASDVDEENRYELNIDYEIIHYAKQTAAIKFNTYELKGGVKGAHQTKIFNFDFKKQHFLSIDDLFLSKKEDLQKLSQMTFEELKKDRSLAENEHLLKQGTSPAAEHYQYFAIKDRFIEFYFPAGQIAPSEQGPQVLAIKKTLLKGMLKPEYINKEKNKNEKKEPIPKRKIVKLPKQSAFNPNQKAIALTFDDGPNPSTTSKILNALKENKGHATFFVLGSRVQYYPDMLSKIRKGGNEIGNHSYSHPLLTRLPLKQAVKQVEETQQIIEKASGFTPTHFRPPYGGTNGQINAAVNMKVTLWDVDPEDWKYRNSQYVANYILTHASSGETVLMHDIYDTSANAAVTIIKELTKQGYQLLTVSELEQWKEARAKKGELNT